MTDENVHKVTDALPAPSTPPSASRKRRDPGTGEEGYVLAIAILSTLYTGLQFLRHIHQLSTGKESFSRQRLALVSFFGEQVVAYFLLSAASSAVPLTNRMRENNDNIFTDSSVAAISMEFLAFIALAVSALISGTYI
ncbi:hypothetical protein K7X08_007112 [Anisodus acutangulus]|uniref:CASP-like protein n=1 Tax=Anisodus acutangulus TaxID=402998 RepID=A0A9Q1LF64_9SOLA|nr:hypothetical protein K7X08_007112 [Anisodus acutangulus]